MTHYKPFTPMIHVVPQGVSGRAEIDHFVVSEEASRFTAIRGASDFVPAGSYCRLLISGQTMMSDTRNEQLTNFEVVRQSRGDVLIAGLGIGMVLLPILRKAEVRSVTVVEKWPEVISLVEPHVLNEVNATARRKLAVIHGDIRDWRPADGVKFDVLYFDIWSGQSTDDLETMTTLHRAFRKYRKVGGWMDSWNRDELRRRKRMGL